jgi:hypothetical protein
MSVRVALCVCMGTLAPSPEELKCTVNGWFALRPHGRIARRAPSVAPGPLDLHDAGAHGAARSRSRRTDSEPGGRRAGQAEADLWLSCTRR